MAITNMYPNLPGHLVEFRDGRLHSDANTDAGYNKSLLILGTAFDGPVKEPVNVTEENVSKIFGSEVDDNGYPSAGTITKAAKQAFRHGFRDVRCMRVTGSRAYTTVTMQTGETVEYEQLTSSPVSGVTKGNALIPIYPIGRPFASDPKFYNANTGDIINNVFFGEYNSPIKINEGQIPMHSDVKIVYSYKKIYDKDGEINNFTDNTAWKSPIQDQMYYDRVNKSTGSSYTASDPATSIQNYVTKVTVDGTEVDTKVKDANNCLGVEVSDPAGFVDINLVMPTTTDSTAKVGLYTTTYDTGNNALDETGILPVTKQDQDIIVTMMTYDNSYNEVAGSCNVLLEKGVDYDLDESTMTIKFKDTSTKVTATPGVRVIVEYYPYVEVKMEEVISSTDPVDSKEQISFELVCPSEDDVTSVTVMNVGIQGATSPTDPVTVDPSEYDIQYTEHDGIVTGAIVFKNTVSPNCKYSVQYTYNGAPISGESTFTVQSINGGSVYNTGKFVIADTTIGGEECKVVTFHKPEAKKVGDADKPFFFTSKDCPTLGNLQKALADYTLNNVFEIVLADELQENIMLDALPNGEYVLNEGGDDGVNITNLNLMYQALSGKRNDDGVLEERGAYQILENYNVDYIYVAGIYADSTCTLAQKYHSDFHHELALLCAVLTYRTKMTHGFIDVKPNRNTTLEGISKYVDHLKSMPNLNYMTDQEGNVITDSDGNSMDIGWYTSVVVGPDPIMSSDVLGTYYGSPALAYAALCASLKPQSSPMNKALPAVRGMKYKFSNKQMDELIGQRMVCFRLKNEGTASASTTPYCVDAMTGGAPNCDYARMTTVAVVTDVVDQVREVCDPFIGEPNTVEQRNAMSALISKRLSHLMEQGEINYYEFEVNATIEQVLIGECTIALTLVCPTELRKITTVVSLRSAA